MPTKLVVLSDTHFSARDPGHGSKRRATLAEILLLRAVHRINRFLKPDITLLLGDLINDGESPEAPAMLGRLRRVVDLLQMPVLVIPGNHDGEAEAFYRVMPRPAEIVEAGGARFLPFLDAEEPGYNARRSPEDLARMRAARGDFPGPVIAVQHVPLLPPGVGESIYRLTNDAAATEAMRDGGITLAIGGHYHPGEPLIRHESGAFVVAPALCESPFAFLEITLDGDDISVVRHELRMPPELGLIDCHTHSHLAYCQENMELAKSLELAEAFGLAGLAITEHSGQLYFEGQTYWRGEFLRDGIESSLGRNERMPAYLAAACAVCPPAILGLELDADYQGRPVVHPEDMAQAQLLLGAVHQLSEFEKPQPDMERAADEFLACLEKFVPSGIQILAHPLRVFRRAGVPVPERLFAPTAQLLRAHGVAAELNFHTNDPPLAFTECCLETGVHLTFGSDAHNLYEIGEFAPHLDHLRQCGVTDVRAVLAPVGMRV
jgi:histidinol phosphatase-like PHP family hydrolase/predicted phosphodiesterase